MAKFWGIPAIYQGREGLRLPSIEPCRRDKLLSPRIPLQSLKKCAQGSLGVRWFCGKPPDSRWHIPRFPEVPLEANCPRFGTALSFMACGGCPTGPRQYGCSLSTQWARVCRERLPKSLIFSATGLPKKVLGFFAGLEGKAPRNPDKWRSIRERCMGKRQGKSQHSVGIQPANVSIGI